MTNNIYCLNSDTKNFSSFLEECPKKQESIMGRAMDNWWKPFTDYQPVKLELDHSDTGKKNYQFDISISLNPFIIFSDEAIEALIDILEPRGQILPVITESKSKKFWSKEFWSKKFQNKKFWGYYPTNPLSNCVNIEKSTYREHLIPEEKKAEVLANKVQALKNRKLILEKIILIRENITDDYLFSIEEDDYYIFVTEKFKQRVEEAGLLGFDFFKM